MVVSRFAPAPTGHLHLGHVVNAVFVWGITKAQSGRVWLRIEDHDRRRSRTEYEASILDDLDWLGLVPDQPSTDEFRAGTCVSRQSDRGSLYEQALAALTERGLVYACSCARSQFADAVGADGERRYPGTCASKRLPLDQGFGLRFRLPATTEVFDDGLLGRQTQVPAEQCGDVLIRDRDGHWTYQFAVAVDDTEQGVTHVIRGRDLLASTGRQIQIARLLGRPTPPRFFHHPLVMKTPAQKLSKSDRDTSVADLRAAGWSPGQVIGRAMAEIGLVERGRAVAPSELQHRMRAYSNW
jgi:glutamyl-tRNA synthetase/glutamyl-Q tRNA(Asp) synthetase